MKQENVNSLLAYYGLLPKLSHAREIVLEAICELGESTDLQISVHLNIPINRITGRITELKNLNLIKTDRHTYTANNDKVRISYLNPDYKRQATNFQIIKHNLEPAKQEKLFQIQRQNC